ncbi:MAG: hypothetical protein IT192_07235 [Microbacteriaceae bacterium]|nr:hypothetical protein [Microbacteriaceae bacterium]
MTISSKSNTLRNLLAALAAISITFACAACSPGGSASENANSKSTSSSGDSSSANSGNSTDQSGTSDQSGSSTGASASALCSDLQNADLNSNSDNDDSSDDTAGGLAIWHKMIGDAPSDIKGAVQKVSDGLDKAIAGDPAAAQSDDWQQAIMQVSQWEIANCNN